LWSFPDHVGGALQLKLEPEHAAMTAPPSAVVHHDGYANVALGNISAIMFLFEVVSRTCYTMIV
jgi:hypothetical protein